MRAVRLRRSRVSEGPPGSARTIAKTGEQQRSRDEATERTAAALSALTERGWDVIGDFDRRHAADHVAVGLGGVFVLASRKSDGCVRVKDGVPWLRQGAESPSDKPGLTTNRQVQDAARALERKLSAHLGRQERVQPVVVLWSEFPQRVAESSQVAFVHGRALREWLTARKPRLEDAARAEVAHAVAEIARDGGRRAPLLPPRHRAA
jgi:hypothetical protein